MKGRGGVGRGGDEHVGSGCHAVANPPFPKRTVSFLRDLKAVWSEKGRPEASLFREVLFMKRSKGKRPG